MDKRKRWHPLHRRLRGRRDRRRSRSHHPTRVITLWHHSQPLPHDERIHLLSPLSAFRTTLHPRPGVPRAHVEMASLSSDIQPPMAEPREPAEMPPSKAKAGKSKISTGDLTFGVTVLNTIGTIPSLVLTTLNAYYYRGNPKVD